MSYLYVFIGGGLGSICRYGIARICYPLQSQFPYATLLANFLSCILLGYLITRNKQELVPDAYKWLLMTGFCGGFSTFSTFTGETFGLFQSGAPGMAFANMGGSIILCLGALYVGVSLAGLK
jgi:CrcB protein